MLAAGGAGEGWLVECGFEGRGFEPPDDVGVAPLAADGLQARGVQAELLEDHAWRDEDACDDLRVHGGDLLLAAEALLALPLLYSVAILRYKRLFLAIIWGPGRSCRTPRRE